MEELDKSMYFRATPAIMENARRLRKNMITSEKILWEKLKGKRVCGLRFRRQHPIDIFIEDFYCHEVRLVVEINGEIHNQKAEYDDGRSGEMERFDIKVIRFKNSDTEENIANVLSEIINVVQQRLKSPPWGI